MVQMTCSRRRFLGQTATGLLVVGSAARSVASSGASGPMQERVRGMLLGSLIGDALGGPIEFQDPAAVQALADPPKRWGDGEVLDGSAVAAAARRVRLRSYADLRPKPEPYAHWTPDAPPGTLTDDSRHKVVLMDALRRSAERRDRAFGPKDLAQAFLDWPWNPAVRDHADYRKLNEDWLREWNYSSRWILGERDPAKALPPERIWSGLPTCAGQMLLLPVAALFPGRPEQAYQAAYALGFFDQGFGKDLNAALVAGLASALGRSTHGRPGAGDWERVLESMRATDPFRYGAVPWTTRPVNRWLDLAARIVDLSERRPARVFAALEREFQQTIKWEAQVPFIVCFAVLRLASYDPLAALQLSIEWGHDTDSYAQLVGAFVGALHGESVFDRALRDPVVRQLSEDYASDLDEWTALLLQLQGRMAGGAWAVVGA